jgi:hypothetical protein
MPKTSHLCAACGYDGLRSPQRSPAGGASHEICPACGFEPGYTDDDQGISPSEWQRQWKKDGGKWFSKGVPRPKGWKPATGKTAKKAAKKKSAVNTKTAAAKRSTKKTREN